MTKRSNAVVTAAELVRGFPQWREQAQVEPVVISNHGRETHVLVGLDMWEALQAEVRTRGDQVDSGRDAVFEFADWIDDAVILCDERLNILFANRVAHAISRKPAKSLDGKPLKLALPEIEGTLLDVHIRRTVASREPSMVDMPSPFTSGAWLRIQTFPVGGRNIVAFRDITEDVQRHRLADVKEALLYAMQHHGQVGYVRLSVRATIVRSEGSFAAMLGLPAERLDGVALADLADKASRSRLRSAIEEVLTDDMPARLTVGFLGNDGEVRNFTVAITALNGAYGTEGAVCVITPD